MGIVQHDKDDGDINGTIEVIAKFVHARSPRSGPPSTQSIAVQSRCKVARRISRVLLHGCTLTGRLVKNRRHDLITDWGASWSRRHDLILPAMPKCQLMPPTKSQKLLVRRMRR